MKDKEPFYYQHWSTSWKKKNSVIVKTVKASVMEIAAYIKLQKRRDFWPSTIHLFLKCGTLHFVHKYLKLFHSEKNISIKYVWSASFWAKMWNIFLTINQEHKYWNGFGMQVHEWHTLKMISFSLPPSYIFKLYFMHI